MSYVIKALVDPSQGLGEQFFMVVGQTNTNKQEEIMQALVSFSPFCGVVAGVRKFGKAWAAILQMPSDVRLFLAQTFDRLIDPPLRGQSHLWSSDKIAHMICPSYEQAEQMTGMVVWFSAISYHKPGHPVMVFARNNNSQQQ